MDNIIRRTDKEIKSLRSEEASVKKMISERDEVFFKSPNYEIMPTNIIEIIEWPSLLLVLTHDSNIDICNF